MKLFRAAIKSVIIACIAFTLTSCGKSLGEKISIDGVENLKVMGFSGVKGDIIFRNESCRKIKLRSVSITLKESGKSIATLTLKDEIEIPRRSDSLVVPTIWKLSDVDAMAAIAASKQIVGGGDGKGLRFDISADAKLGAFARKVEYRDMVLSDILRALNIK